MGVRLAVVGPDDGDLVAAALRLRTGADQQRFALLPAVSFPLASADPDRTAFVVLSGGGDDDGEVVGAGVLHAGAAAPGRDAELAGLVAGSGEDPAAAVLLRSFVIDARAQGRGLGTAAARAAVALAPALALGRAGPARAVVLTVNERNTAGLRAYARAGFTDAGRYLGGDAGPQRAMLARCARPAHPADRAG